MHSVALYIDGTERTGRAEALASSATNAPLLINGRDLVRPPLYHRNSSCGAVTKTGITCNAVVEHRAVLLDPYGMANLYGRLVGNSDPINSSGGANLRAFHTFGSAIASLVRHLGLHESGKVCRWAKYLIGAGRDAKLTTGTAFVEIADALTTGRNNRSLTFRYFLIGDKG